MSYSNLEKRILKLELNRGVKQPIFLMNPTDEEIVEATKQGQQIFIIEMEGLGSKDPHAIGEKTS